MSNKDLSPALQRILKEGQEREIADKAVDTLARYVVAIGFLSRHIEGFKVPKTWEPKRDEANKILQDAGFGLDTAIWLVTKRADALLKAAVKQSAKRMKEVRDCEGL